MNNVPKAFQIEWISVTMLVDFPKPVFHMGDMGRHHTYLAQAGSAKKNVAVVRIEQDARWHYWHKASGEWQEAGHYETADQAKAAVQRDIGALV